VKVASVKVEAAAASEVWTLATSLYSIILQKLVVLALDIEEARLRRCDTVLLGE
jgi:hypothetical protein